MQAARVLLVEDDPAMVRFVELAVDDLGIALQACTTVAEAIAALRVQPAHLIVTDLMLPGAPGTVLLQRLRQEAALLGNARVVVCSAGINAPMKAELAGLGVWRQLHKPVAVETLRTCVREGLAPEAAPAPQALKTTGGDADEAAAVLRYFAGNRALFDMYRGACLRQFPVDLGDGDKAFEVRDAVALRRLAHSLRTVLLSLGLTEASACAKRLEQAALHADWNGVAEEWPGLRAVLAAICAVCAV